jgi:hypothetical protein
MARTEPSEDGILRLDIHKAEDLQYLIDTGLIWKGGPRTQRVAIDAMLAGTAKPSGKEPENVAALLAKAEAPGEEAP